VIDIPANLQKKREGGTLERGKRVALKVPRKTPVRENHDKEITKSAQIRKDT